MADVQLKYAQQEIRKAANEYISSARMRLAGTRFEGDIEKVWSLMSKLNSDIIKAIK